MDSHCYLREHRRIPEGGLTGLGIVSGQGEGRHKLTTQVGSWHLCLTMKLGLMMYKPEFD